MQKYDKNFTRLNVDKNTTIVRNGDRFDIYDRLGETVFEFKAVDEAWIAEVLKIEFV